MVKSVGARTFLSNATQASKIFFLFFSAALGAMEPNQGRLSMVLVRIEPVGAAALKNKKNLCGRCGFCKHATPAAAGVFSQIDDYCRAFLVRNLRASNTALVVCVASIRSCGAARFKERSRCSNDIDEAPSKMRKDLS